MKGTKRILVAGSKNFMHKDKDGGEDANTKDEEFREACRGLGKALAEKGFTIIVSSDGADRADRYVVEGANQNQGSAGGKAKVIVFRREGQEPPFHTRRNDFPNVQFDYRTKRGPWGVADVSRVLCSDGTILIGGGDGTKHVCYTSIALERPVLAIPTLGGASEQLFRENLDAVYRLRKSTADRIELLENPWDPNHAPVCVEMITDLIRHNPYRSGATNWAIIISAFALLVLWIFLFLMHPLCGMGDFFLLLANSALLGTLLRNCLRLLDDPSLKLSWREIGIEATTGCLVAFGLSVLYLGGGLIITGNDQFLNLNPSEDIASFSRVSISFSILGLSAGLLIEGAAAKLLQGLEKSSSLKSDP